MKRKYGQVYEDASGKWRWRVRSGNGRIIMCCGESFSERRKAVESMAMILDSIIDKTLVLALHEEIKAHRR